jgi:hypothetical protein
MDRGVVAWNGQVQGDLFMWLGGFLFLFLFFIFYLLFLFFFRSGWVALRMGGGHWRPVFEGVEAKQQGAEQQRGDEVCGTRDGGEGGGGF